MKKIKFTKVLVMVITLILIFQFNANLSFGAEIIPADTWISSQGTGSFLFVPAYSDEYTMQFKGNIFIEIFDSNNNLIAKNYIGESILESPLTQKVLKAYLTQGETYTIKIVPKINSAYRFIIIGATPSGGDETARLQGKVAKADADRDPSNNLPIAGALVSVRKNNTSETRQTYTDANGFFSFEDLAVGEYTVTISKEGFVTYRDEHLDIPSTGKTLNIIMEVDSHSELRGKVTIADDDTDMTNNLPLEGVQVTATKLGITAMINRTAVTAADGSYSIIDMTPGLYRVTYTKAGYMEIIQDVIIHEGEVTVANATLEVISDDFSGTGTASGTVINALTGAGVESGLTLNVRRGYDVTYGDIIETTYTGSNGAYSVTLPAGNYCVEVIDERSVPDGYVRYQSGFFNIKVLGNKTIGNQNGTVTPILPEGQIRVILRWGEYPWDLDSHMTGPRVDSEDRFHVYWSNKQYRYYDENGIYTTYVDLDVDDVTSYGPETTTIYKQTDGIYRFFVHDYSNRNLTDTMAMANSGAYVQVYISDGLVATYYVPQEPGTLWHVFEYDSTTKQIHALNTMTYQSSYADIGLMSAPALPEPGSIEEDIRIIAESISEDK
ncbi:MAG TPA: hypothetical protein GXX49_00635 [Clostridiaceae bacterium]|nr:hypothetical protein [Clostridiaceae bacterium]